MSIISYAQNFEDVMLWRALGHIERGFYIDIGAQHPTIDSVSRAFHEHGWHGIHVEPTPHYAELLRQQRPGDTVIQAAVGNGPALSLFYEIPNTGISTADARIAAQHRERGFDVQEIIVNFVALSAIFETCTEEIHWLKIDVEGFEKQLLSSWGTCATRPWIVVIESTLPLTQTETYENWESIIIGYGYSPVYFDGLNRYYVSDAHGELKAAFALPPNVFDGFTLNGTASAPFHRLIEERCQEKISETVTQSEQQITVLQREAKLLGASLSSLTETYAGQQQNWQQAEQALSEQNRQARQQLEALHEQTSQARQEIEKILRIQTQRELEVAGQLLAGQLQAEQDKTELVRKNSEQERALHSQHSEREKVHAEQTSQIRLQLESLLRQQVQREQQIAAQLLAVHQQAAQEKAELAHIQVEQTRALHSQLAEREQLFSRQLLARQQELHQQHQSRIDRAQEITTKLLTLQQQAAESAAEQAHSQREQERKLHLLYAEREEKLKQQLQDRQEDLQKLQKDRARREQEMGEQLLAIQRQAEHEMVEQAQKHLKQASALHHLHAEREQSLIQERQAGQQDLRRLEQDRVQHEKDHAEQISRSQQELQSLLRNQAQREQEINAKLLTIQQQTHQENDEHKRLLAACTAFEAELKAEVLLEQRTNLRLRQSLAEVQKNLSTTHASMTWRMTSPLRHLASLIVAEKNSIPISPIVTEEFDPIQETTTEPPSIHPQSASVEPYMPIPEDAINSSSAVLVMETGAAPSANIPPVSEFPSINAQNASVEATMPHPAQVTMPSTPAPTPVLAPASTLDELLAHHDQHFVEYAYQTLLGRAPDPEGRSYYLGRLRTGYSKIQILLQLRLSKEGQACATDLLGLDPAIQIHQRGKLPLIGWLFRWINDTEGNQPIERKLRGIENQLGLLSDESSRRFTQMEAVLAGLHQLVVQQTQSVVIDLGGTPKKCLNPEIMHLQPEAPNGLKQLSPRARNIYFQLKTMAAKNTGRDA